MIAQKALREQALVTEKTEFFIQPSSCSGWLRVTSGVRGCLGRSRVALGGHMLPQGVMDGLGGSGVGLGVTNGLVGLQMASWGHGCPHGVMGGHGGREWPLWVVVNLRGCG
jgi:hypothetical protein